MSGTQITLTDSQITELNRITNNRTTNFPDGYRYISGIINNNPNVNDDTKLWFNKASEINANDPNSSANFFIRSVTNNGLLYDRIYKTPKEIQDISDQIAPNVLTDIVNMKGIPQLDTMLSRDISAALEYGGLTIGGWGGSFYYWNANYKDGKTVGEYILSNPREYEKFLTVNAKALDDASSKSGLWEKFSTAYKAQTPVDIQLEIFRRSLFGNYTGDTDKINGWFFDKANKKWFKKVDTLIFADEITTKQLNELRGIRLEKAGWERPYTYNLIKYLQELFNQAETITSPIILDLDGSNGVETISKSAGIHFDLDGNKFAETTGWVGKNDGLLVLDKNGNGKIDDGTELFGNNTILKNGSKAAHGFAALSELDINKDGKINASDSAYTKVRVWKDSNSNGVVDTGELLTLTQAGVKSLNTGFTEQTQTDAQGNQHLQAGSYTRTDGSTRAMNDVWFTTDTARTIDQDLVTINATIAALPELQGFGNVHSLHQAIARDTSGRLQTLVQNFTQETDPSARDTIMTTLLYAWVGVEGNNPDERDPTQVYGHLIDARKVEVLEAFMGQGFLGTWCWGTLDPNPHAQSAPILEAMFGKLAQFMENQLLAQTHFKSLYDSINLSWNSTTNQFDIDVSATVKILETKYTEDATAGTTLILDFANSLKNTAGEFGQEVLAALAKQGDITGQGFAFSLAMMGYDNIIIGTANNDTLNSINGQDCYLIGNAGDDTINASSGNDIIYGAEGNDTIDAGNGNDTIEGGAGNDALYSGSYYDSNNGNDIYLFNKGFGQDTISDYDSTTGNIDTIRFGAGILPTDITLNRDANNLYISLNGTTDKITVQSWFSNSVYRVEKVAFANGTVWDTAKLASTAYTGTANADNLSGSEQNETFYGLAGDDTINASSGNDIIYGAEGNDTIDAGNGNDTIEGGAGNDALYSGSYYDSNNGNDIYLFNKGFGQDTISDYDSTTGNIDTIRFGAGILPTDITLNRDANNLYISLNGTTDNITVQSWFSNSVYRVEKVAFANGTVWDLTKLVIGVSQGTASADLIVGTNQNETLKGLAGNDTVFGYAGNDNLDGGEGNDILIGGIGKDTLTGGLGIDRFDYCKLTDSLLSGFDIIKDFNATTGNDLFRVSTARAGFVKVGAVNTLNAADIGAKLTATAFKSNFAAQFSFGQKTFVSINDATAGFNAATDAIIEVTGLTGTLNVNNFVISVIS
ncbi:calcium-binding protein [Anabaena azotica]|uniref:calcium-binding protein n=1 Tax=Anabaena azotica TaxID=197653 RepID=UPI0039A77AD7